MLNAHQKRKHLADILEEKEQAHLYSAVRPFAPSPNKKNSSKGKTLPRSHHQPCKTCVRHNMQWKKKHLNNPPFRLIHFR